MRSHSDSSRREFMKNSLIATGALAGCAASREDPGDEKPAAVLPPLPARKLGRSGIAVSVLNLGTAFALDQRLLDRAYARGVRYFDTADCYDEGQSEREIAAWFERTGKRKEIFLVTKCHPTGGPKELPKLLDERLANLKTDFVDLIFIHALKHSEYGPESAEWLRKGELKTVAEKLRKSGKCRLVGFSSHDPEKVEYLHAAAEGGFIDACMVKYDPRTQKNDEMNGALDRAAQAGLGVIAMKTQSSAEGFAERWEKHVTSGVNVHQAIIKAVLADQRLAGMTSQMSSPKIIDENTEAARDTKPLAAADHARLMGLYAAGPHRLCETCNGACAQAHGGQTLHDVARAVMYHDLYGRRAYARALLAPLAGMLAEISPADLDAARRACRDTVDYPAIVARARKLLTSSGRSAV